MEKAYKPHIFRLKLECCKEDQALEDLISTLQSQIPKE